MDQPGGPLSGMESLMWRLAADDHLRASFGVLLLLDQPPQRDRLRSRLTAAAGAVPRLRCRVRGASRTGRPPTWMPEDASDAAPHLREVTLPAAPASEERRLLDLAATIIAAPFSPELSPWELVLVTGLEEGRAAAILKVHHVLSDGEGLTLLAGLLADASPDAPEPTPDPFVGEDATDRAPWEERAVLSAVEATGTVARRARDAARWLADGAAEPRRFADAGARAIDTARSLQRQLLVLDPQRSSLWTRRSTERHLEVVSVPFASVRNAAHAAHTSVNSVFVTAVLRSAAAYHRAQGRAVQELRVAVPVSTRAGERPAGNAFVPTRVVLPTGEDLAVAVHLAQVDERLRRHKHERATPLIEPLAAVGDAVPTPALLEVFRRQAATIDVVASNVRAAPDALYVAGARVGAVYGLGPLVGTPANVTMVSYEDRIDVGLHIDPAAIAEPSLLRDTLVGAFHEVCHGGPSGG